MRTTFLANVESNRIGTTCRSGVEIVVDSNQEVAGANSRTACTCHTFIESTGTEIGLFTWRSEFVGKRFILSFATNSQVLTLWLQRRSLVTIARNVQLVGDAFCQLACQFGTLFERDACHGDERTHIGGSHTGMGTGMLTHVYQLSGFTYCTESRLHHILGLTDESDDRAVGSLSRVNIQKFDTFYFLNLVSNLLDYRHVASLTEIRNTFYNFL